MKWLFLSCLTLTHAYSSIFQFQSYVTNYQKIYSSEHEYDMRYQIFSQNMKYIREHNLQNKSWTLDMNEWTDLTWNEFKDIHKKGYVQKPRVIFSYDTNSVYNSNETLDWREKGVVNPIKDQGQCGSCWAFSAIASIESAYAITHQSLYDLSEQQLVDCSSSFGNYGCNGGLMDDAFTYAETNALCLEKDYPYKAENDACVLCKGKVSVSSFVDIPPNNEEALFSAVKQQPISVAIEADQMDFQFYKSGVFDGTCGVNLDHGVVIVGYGIEENQPYWIVRNSWGDSWGENGYIRIARNKNKCGINLAASYPVV